MAKIKAKLTSAKNWIKKNIKKVLVGTAGMALAATGTQISFTNGYIDYPLTVNTDTERLEYAYRAAELLRLNNNNYRQEYKNKIITEEQWDAYLRDYFRPKSKWILGEVARLEDKLGYTLVPEGETDAQSEIRMSANDLRKNNGKNSTKWNIDIQTISIIPLK